MYLVAGTWWSLRSADLTAADILCVKRCCRSFHIDGKY